MIERHHSAPIANKTQYVYSVAMAETLMAQAVADAIGATKRQVQIWTDAGAVHCIPETDRMGRGRQRLYDQSELPKAAIIARLAEFQVPIGVLQQARKMVEVHLTFGTEYQEALEGRHESWICLTHHTWPQGRPELHEKLFEAILFASPVSEKSMTALQWVRP